MASAGPFNSFSFYHHEVSLSGFVICFEYESELNLTAPLISAPVTACELLLPSTELQYRRQGVKYYSGTLTVPNTASSKRHFL